MIEHDHKLGLTIHKPVFEGTIEGLNIAQLGVFEITSFQSKHAQAICRIKNKHDPKFGIPNISLIFFLSTYLVSAGDRVRYWVYLQDDEAPSSGLGLNWRNTSTFQTFKLSIPKVSWCFMDFHGFWEEMVQAWRDFCYFSNGGPSSIVADLRSRCAQLPRPRNLGRWIQISRLWTGSLGLEHPGALEHPTKGEAVVWLTMVSSC